LLALRGQLESYGRLGLGVYFTLWAVNVAVFFVVLRLGLQDRVPWVAEHIGTDGATLVGAWALGKLMMVPRIALAVAITPIVARWMGRTPPAEPAVVPVADAPDAEDLVDGEAAAP
jgi:hypothetical protein